MVDRRIAILVLLEMCVPCTTVLWVLLVEGTSLVVPVHALRHLHNLRSGLNSCWSSSKRTQRSLSASRTSSQVRLRKWPKKQHTPDPEFRFAGNKKQYELNREVVEKIDEALETVDADERSAKLNEGKDLLLERNKHILLAEKYG